MLGRHTHALTLDALDDSGSDESRHDGVFRVVFEVASAEGRAVQVHAWAQYDIDTIFQRLVTDGLTYLLHQLGIPGGGQTGADGESCGIVAVGVIVALGVYMYSGRTVGNHRGGDAQTGNLYCGSGSTSHISLLVTEHGT